MFRDIKVLKKDISISLQLDLSYFRNLQKKVEDDNSIAGKQRLIVVNRIAEIIDFLDKCNRSIFNNDKNYIKKVFKNDKQTLVIENNEVLKEFYQSLSLSQYDEFIKELENYLPEEVIVDIKYLRNPPDRIVSHLNTKFKDGEFFEIISSLLSVLYLIKEEFLNLKYTYLKISKATENN